MKVLIVSDTHGRESYFLTAVAQEAPFDLLIHCGDAEGNEEAIQGAVEVFGCKTCIVAGNNDFFTYLNREEEIRIAGKRAFVTHGHNYGVSLDPQIIMEEARARNCDMVFFGHTHKPLVMENGGVLAVNPGSLSFPRQEGRKPSYAVMDIERNQEAKIRIEYLER